MELNKLKDQKLVAVTEGFIREECGILTKILLCFQEIERRRLYSDYGYSSLFEMAMKHFKYSEDQAYRRVNAMRLLKDNPGIEDKITSGDLNLTNLSLAQNLFKKEDLSASEKLEILNEISGKTTREVKKVTEKYSSEVKPTKPDYIKDIGDNKVEVFFTASGELKTQLEDLKKIYPDLSLGEIIQVLCELRLKPAAPRRHLVKTSKAQVRRDVFQNAQHKCEICSSKHHLEIDHIIPQAKGGSSHPANLRLLCRSCNQRAAIKEFGVEKISRYIT